MCTELSNCQKKTRVTSPDFIHCDFILGSDAKSLVYDRIVGTLKE